MHRSIAPAFILSATVLCSLAGRVGAQIAYTEGADLNGQNLGSVAAGDNTITGSISATVIGGGMVSGDAMDQFSFTIPAGVSVTGLSLAITNLNCSGTTSFNPGVQIVGVGFLFAASTSGTNPLTIPSPGYLDPGAFTFAVFTGVSGADMTFTGRSFNYVLRIHVDPITGACCNRWTGSCGVMTAAACASVGLRYDGDHAACSPATCKACPADFNGGGLAVADIFEFLNAWFAGCP